MHGENLNLTIFVSAGVILSLEILSFGGGSLTLVVEGSLIYLHVLLKNPLFPLTVIVVTTVHLR